MKLRHSSCRKRHIREEVHYARADKTEVKIEKKDEASERQKLGLFFQDHTSKPLGERELFSFTCLMCGIITPLTLSITLIQAERSLQGL